MIVVLMGKTASGKDTICNKLCENYGYEKMVTYTTRPMRDGEINGKTYNFVTEKEFNAMEQHGFFLESKEYRSVFGVWRYGSPLDAFNSDDGKDKVIILTPDGVRDLIRAAESGDVGCSYCVIYLYANNASIKKRLLGRGDDSKEAERRVVADNRDFKDAPELADRIFYNNSEADLEEVVVAISQYLRNKEDDK